jgi:maleylpyruvate isomerase
MHHWLRHGFLALERILSEEGKAGRFCFGDAPTLADVCLIPQAYAAQRRDFDLSEYPKVMDIINHCNDLPAFERAHPTHQPDANGQP